VRDREPGETAASVQQGERQEGRGWGVPQSQGLPLEAQAQRSPGSHGLAALDLASLPEHSKTDEGAGP